MMSRSVCFSPESTIHTKHGGAAAKVGEKKKTVMMRIWIFKLQKGSVGTLLKNIGEKVAKAMPPLTAAAASRRRCSRKVSSASLGRSWSYAETLDSQRAEAIEDCIEFLNSSSSSSLLRSNSVSSSC